MLLTTLENPCEFLEVWASPSIPVHGGLNIHDVILIFQAYSNKKKKLSAKGSTFFQLQAVYKMHIDFL